MKKSVKALRKYFAIAVVQIPKNLRQNTDLITKEGSANNYLLNLLTK
ncbi:hypothetical protein [Nostoc sp. NMS8]|nr:hypothetical protein [Nostoc sp. NMS8]MBN3963186.1 hypothetical protein [Nostoc sp. NMS8]